MYRHSPSQCRLRQVDASKPTVRVNLCQAKEKKGSASNDVRPAHPFDRQIGQPTDDLRGGLAPLAQTAGESPLRVAHGAR